jgi:hypothetical protein
MTGACHHNQLFLLRWGLINFFAWAGQELVILLISASHVAWVDRHEPPVLGLGLYQLSLLLPVLQLFIFYWLLFIRTEHI